MLSNKPSPHTFFQLPFPTLQTRRRRISLSPFLSMDSSQGCFLLDVKTMESSRPPERKTVRPNTDQAFNCPRCSSTNTKFCYYNNYSLSQPRYFCKTCRRYWTEGGPFRNVPVGGSSRKNKRTSSSSSAGSKIKVPVEELHQQNQTQNPRIIHQGCQDLNLAFPSPSDNDLDENPKSPSMGLSLGSFMPPLPILETSASYSARFPLVEFRPSLGFPTSDAFENAYGSLQCLEESTGAKIFFPVDDLKQVAASSGSSDHHQFDHNRQKVDPNGYWNGVLGGGSW